MASNRGVVYLGPGKVEVQSLDFPRMRAPNGKEIHHGVILKVVSTNIPGLYVTEDPGSKDAAAQQGNLRMRFGLGWAKSHRFATGQTPVLRYNRQLMQAILHDRLPIAKVVNATVISLDDAPKGYSDFDKGVARKFVLDPHGTVAAAA